MIDTTPSIVYPQVKIGDIAAKQPRAGTDDIRELQIPLVTEQPQISTSTYTADGNPAEVTIDGALFAGGVAGSTIAQVVSNLNAIALFAMIAVASNPAGTTLQIDFLNNADHTVSGSVNFAAFTTSQAAADNLEIAPGQAVYWASPTAMLDSCNVRAATAGGEFAGVALRTSLPSDTEATALGFSPGYMIPGRSFIAASYYTIPKVDNRDAVAADGDVYIITSGTDRNRFAASDGATPGEIELTVTAGLAGEAVGGDLDGGPVVTLPGGSTTVDNTDAAQLLPLFMAAYAGTYTFSLAANVITAVQVTASGSDPVFTDASAGAASIADSVTVNSVEADAEILPGAKYRAAADANAGALLELPR